jgi:hypothetical protein
MKLRGQRFVLTVPVIALLAAIALGSDDSDPGLEQLAWMAGHWAGEQGGVQMEEVWTAPGGGMMIGLHRDVRAGKPAFFEYLRIEETDDGIFYVASPMGRTPGTRFRLVSVEAGKVRFENPEHDFPQRIIYWKDGDTLVARAEADTEDGVQGSEWRWQRRP